MSKSNFFYQVVGTDLNPPIITTTCDPYPQPPFYIPYTPTVPIDWQISTYPQFDIAEYNKSRMELLTKAYDSLIINPKTNKKALVSIKKEMAKILGLEEDWV